MNWAHKLDSGPRSSMMFWRHKVHLNLQQILWCGRITAWHISQLPIFQCQTYQNPCLRNWLLSRIRHKQMYFFMPSGQARLEWLQAFSFNQAKSSSSKALLPETPLSRRHSKNSFPPCHSYMAMRHFPSLSTCAATVLYTLLATPLASWGCLLLGDKSLFPGKVLPSAWEEREKKPTSAGRKKGLEKHSSFSSRWVSGISQLAYCVTTKRVWLIPYMQKAVIILLPFFLFEFELLHFEEFLDLSSRSILSIISVFTKSGYNYCS